MTWTTRPRSKHGDLAAIVAGDGPLVLLLHGVGLRAEAWAPVIDQLAAKFRVIAPDLPGHGDSPLGGCATLSNYGDAIAPLLDQRAIVLGHSMGAMIALDLAARFPTQVAGVGALNAIYDRSAAAQDAVRQRAAALDGVSVADATTTLRRWFEEQHAPARAACHDWLTSVDPSGYKTAYTVFATEAGPSREALAELTHPALFMTGADDPNSTPEMSRQMADLAPHGVAKTVEGAAHMMPMTHPDETTAAVIQLATEVLS